MVYQFPVWKLKIFLTGGSQGQKTYFFGLKLKNAIFDGIPPPAHQT